MSSKTKKVITPKVGGIINDSSITDKVIVFDLDDTLVFTVDEPGDAKKLVKNTSLKDRIYCFTIKDENSKDPNAKTKIYGIMRPHMKSLLKFCGIYFKAIIIWSAGREHYVNGIVETIFKDMKQPHSVFNFDSCAKKLDSKGEVKSYSKPLLNLVEHCDFISLKNTFILDDRHLNFKVDNPDNGLLIPSYSPRPNKEELYAVDDALLKLIYWLKLPEVMRSKDVRELDKSDIFTRSIESYRKELDMDTEGG